MKRCVILVLGAILVVTLWACAEVDVHIGGAGTGDITVETHTYAWGGESHEYFEAVDATYVFDKFTRIWQTDSGTSALVRRFDEYLYIDVSGSFQYGASVWSFDGRHGHYELGAFTGFGGIGEVEFERISEVCYAYYISDGWLSQQVNVQGYLEQGYVSSDHTAISIHDIAAQEYEFHVWGQTGEDHIFQTADVHPGESVDFGVSVGFFYENFAVHSLIYDYGW